MEILIGILCVPAGLLALCLAFALIYAFDWLLEHGLWHMIFFATIGGMSAAIVNIFVRSNSYTMLIASAITGAAVGLLIYLCIEYIKRNSKDDKANGRG